MDSPPKYGAINYANNTEKMVITHSPLTQNNGNLTLPLIGGTCPIFLLKNIYC